MVKKITLCVLSLFILLLSTGCGKEESGIKFYKMIDRQDCDLCISEYCFFYDSSFHYTNVYFGFYEDKDGFLQDSLTFKDDLDSVKSTEIPIIDGTVGFDTIRCACGYESRLRFSFEMIVTKQGKCELHLNCYRGDGIYVFELTPSERNLVAYAVSQLSTKDTGWYLTYNKREVFASSDSYFAIQICNGNNNCYYRGNHNADDVPEAIYFFGDAMGAIAQNHFTKQSPLPGSDTVTLSEFYWCVPEKDVW